MRAHLVNMLFRTVDALGTSGGVRGHGAAGRAGGTAPTARSQTPPFHIGMGEAAAAAGHGGPPAGDGGAGDARALRRRGRAARPAAQHTAAGRRVRPGCASAAQGPLSASRADEEQLPAAAQQVRERRARVGGRGRRRRGGRVRAARSGQEGGPATEGDALVGAHGRAARRAAAGQRRAAALRDGAAPRAARARAARRVTRPPLPYHAYIP